MTIQITVQTGDTYSDIAANHGITLSALLRENNIPSNVDAYAGEQLAIPTHVTFQSRACRDTLHIVKPGESIRDVANMYGCTVTQILACNELWSANVDSLLPGTRINIPVARDLFRNMAGWEAKSQRAMVGVPTGPMARVQTLFSGLAVVLAVLAFVRVVRPESGSRGGASTGPKDSSEAQSSS